MVSRPPEESELVERARLGDESAYEELVRAHQGIAFRTAYLVVGSAAEAEEAAQEGFVKAYRALGRFRPGSPFRPWLLQIVANEARNRRRSEARRAALAVRVAAAQAPTRRRRIEGHGGFAGMPDPQSSSGGAAPSPEDALLAGEERERLREAVNELREEERLVIACRYFLGLSEEETAAALDVRRGTVKSRTSRALDHLRESYA